jgi:hypothetical protein
VRCKHELDDNINIGFRGTGCDGIGWIELCLNRVQLRVFVNTMIILRVPQLWGIS